jgi:tRNA-2-methylthio-N6-dimethylallyladenosine synthase
MFLKTRYTMKNLFILIHCISLNRRPWRYFFKERGVTYFFETYGCQMNIAESAAIEQQLIARGWTKSASAETADLAIINTCSVRATAENRIFGRLGWYSGLKALRAGKPGAKDKSLDAAAAYVKNGPKPLRLAVMGCMAERLLKSLQRDWPCVDYVVGTFAKQHFSDILDEIEIEHGVPSSAAENADEKNHDAAQHIRISPRGVLSEDPVYTFASLSLEPGAFTSYVPIMNGCNNFCTYCIVPYVRGREVSRPVSDILKELDELGKRGVREVTLLGQNVNSYCSDTVTFPALMQRISDHLAETNSSIGWVRFESSHPKDLSEELIDVIAKNPVICRHIHLPVQHGSSRILKAMNRKYTREDYLALVDKIRANLPDASLTTDIMLGFPGETDEDVNDVLSLMKTVRYESAFMYYYNPREGTPAASMAEQIPMSEKKVRLQKIIDLQLVITQEEMAKRVGNTVQVLAESVSRDDKSELLGKTSQDERVAFKADTALIGRFVTVHLDSLNGNTFKGTRF